MSILCDATTTRSLRLRLAQLAPGHDLHQHALARAAGSLEERVALAALFHHLQAHLLNQARRVREGAAVHLAEPVAQGAVAPGEPAEVARGHLARQGVRRGQVVATEEGRFVDLFLREPLFYRLHQAVAGLFRGADDGGIHAERKLRILRHGDDPLEVEEHLARLGRRRRGRLRRSAVPRVGGLAHLAQLRLVQKHDYVLPRQPRLRQGGL